MMRDLEAGFTLTCLTNMRIDILAHEAYPLIIESICEYTKVIKMIQV
jgi:hypothetical protein